MGGTSSGEAPEILVCRGMVPEVYLRASPPREELDQAFAGAFAAPRPAVFESADAEFLARVAAQPVALLHRVARDGLSAKLDIYLSDEHDVLPDLRQLSARLAVPLLVDVGENITDDTAFLIAPDGLVARGWFPDLAAAIRHAGASAPLSAKAARDPNP